MIPLVCGVLAVVLVVAGGIIVAAQRTIAIVAPSRIDTLAADGDRRAVRLARLLDDAGATRDALGLAAIGGAQVVAVLVVLPLREVLEPAWFLLIVPMVVVLTFAAQRLIAATVRRSGTERTALRTSLAVAAVTRVLGPVARVLTVPARRLEREAVQLQEGEGVNTEALLELREVLDRASGGEVIEHDEAELINSVVAFGDTIAREVMVPRLDMVCLSEQATVQEALDLSVEHGLSRFPVSGGNVDNVSGLLYVKDLLVALQSAERDDEARRVAVGSLMRTARFVPEQKKLPELLAEMRAGRYHMAIVIDEYGGTSGLVTLEDLLEELVGDITDEYDTDEERVVALAEGGWRVDARMPLDDLAEAIGIDLDVEDADTVGGAVLALAGHVPASGDVVRAERAGLALRATRVRRHRIEIVDVVPDERHTAAS